MSEPSRMETTEPHAGRRREAEPVVPRPLLGRGRANRVGTAAHLPGSRTHTNAFFTSPFLVSQTATLCLVWPDSFIMATNTGL